jgi:hypothetical protein
MLFREMIAVTYKYAVWAERRILYILNHWYLQLPLCDKRIREAYNFRVLRLEALTVKTEAAAFPKSFNFYQTTRRHASEYCDLHRLRVFVLGLRENILAIRWWWATPDFLGFLILKMEAVHFLETADDYKLAGHNNPKHLELEAKVHCFWRSCCS